MSEYNVGDKVVLTGKSSYTSCTPPILEGTQGTVVSLRGSLAMVEFKGYNYGPLACWGSEIVPEVRVAVDDLRRVLDGLAAQGYKWTNFTLTHPTEQEEF